MRLYLRVSSNYYPRGAITTSYLIRSTLALCGRGFTRLSLDSSLLMWFPLVFIPTSVSISGLTLYLDSAGLYGIRPWDLHEFRLTSYYHQVSACTVRLYIISAYLVHRVVYFKNCPKRVDDAHLSAFDRCGLKTNL